MDYIKGELPFYGGNIANTAKKIYNQSIKHKGKYIYSESCLIPHALKFGVGVDGVSEYTV